MPQPELFWEDEDGKLLGSDVMIPPIPLFVGMPVTIHSREEEFKVKTWRYHHGHSDEGYGLHVTLERVLPLIATPYPVGIRMKR